MEQDNNSIDNDDNQIEITNNNDDNQEQNNDEVTTIAERVEIYIDDPDIIVARYSSNDNIVNAETITEIPLAFALLAK